MKFLRIALVALIATAAVSQANAGTCFLRQSTASQNLTLPTFVDSTDGNTAETGLTIANTDIKLTKGWTATSQTNKNSGGATHIATGDYYATFDATDTNTVGPLKIKVHVSGALPVWIDCFVLPAVNYDALFVTAPGAAGGFLIAGTNADFDVTANVSMAGGLTITQSTSNTAALVVTGNGTGNGATFTSGSGATGNGATFIAASTNGSGMATTGTGTGSGQLSTGGATGHGFNGIGGSTSGNGFRAAGTAGNSAAMNLVGQGSAAGLLTTGGATGAGLSAVGGSTSGAGISAAGTAGNSTALNLAGQGSAAGLTSTGGATGHGISAVGGATSGSGLRAVASTSGNGIIATGVGTTQAGIAATGGSTSSAGISATGGGTGSGILATSGGGATGNGITATAASTNGNGIGLTATGTGVTMTMAPADMIQVSGDAGAADALETWLDGTAGSAIPLGIVDQGTAQSATGTTLVLRSALAMGDDTANGMTLVACGSTQGYCQSRAVTDYVSSTDTATVETWTVTPSGTITYYLFATAPSSGGGGLDAAGVRAAVGLASANLDTQLGTIDTNVDAILVDTGTTLQAELDGIQADTEDLQTRVPAALVSGRIDASVGAMAANTVTASAIATDAIGAAELAADAGTELGTANWATTTRVLTAGTNIALAKGTGVTGFNDLSAADVNAEVDTALADIHLDHLLATDYDPASKPGTATALLNELVENDGGVSRFTVNALENGPSGSGASAEAIADEVETRTIAGVTTVGTVNALAANSVNASALASDAVAEIQSGLASQASVDDLPTNAELSTALGTADDAVLAAIAALNNLSAAQVRDLVIEDQGSISLGCALASILAYTSGDIATTGANSTYEESTGTETRLTITVASPGNRTSTITCPTY